MSDGYRAIQEPTDFASHFSSHPARFTRTAKGILSDAGFATQSARSRS